MRQPKKVEEFVSKVLGIIIIISVVGWLLKKAYLFLIDYF
jgi:hypothetical protein